MYQMIRDFRGIECARGRYLRCPADITQDYSVILSGIEYRVSGVGQESGCGEEVGVHISERISFENRCERELQHLLFVCL